MDYQELIERLRKKVISPFDLGPVADAIESLLAENERLNAELAKYRDAPVVAWYDGGYITDGKAVSFDALSDGLPLIVKPDENK